MPPEEDCDLVDDPQSCPLHCDLRQELMTMDGAAHNGELILPFPEAAAKGDVEEVIRSLRIDPTLINTHHPETGNTALIAAAEENRSEVIALLLELGADVTASNFANQTAAHVANDGVRAQLLSAVTRTSFPQLSMMQGDLERVKYLQSIGHGHYLHNRNGQGLTPAMLLLRDVDLFDNLQTTGSDYQPVAVLQELLRHHVDTDLLDTITNVSDMTSPLRRQLMDALETPETDAHDDASCDLCLNTKPPLCVAPPAIQNQSSEEVSGDGISNDLVEEKLDPAAGPGAKAELQEEIYFQEMENIHQTQGRKRNSISRRWVTDPTPEHLTRQSSLKRQPSLPPLHMRTGGEVSKLEGLGLRYLVQESYSEPNVLDCDYNPDPLCNIKSIKGHIWQRLASSESSRDSKTFPPLSHSPRSLLPTRLRPLSKTHLRNKGGHRSRTAVSCDEPDDSGIEGSPCEEKLQKSLQTSEDMILSRDLVHISLDCCICSGNQKSHREDCAKTAEGRSRTESGRRETVAERETPRIHISCRDLKPLLHTNGEAQARNCREMAASSLHLELGHGESFKKNRTSDMEEENVPGIRDDKQLEIQRSEDKLETATSNNEESKKVELKIMDSSRSPRTGHVPFVHITFSEQEPEREANCSPCKPLFTKRKTKPGSLLLNGNHSFNVLAQKENEKTKKNRKGRIMSAPDTTKQQRPLSNSNRGHGKNVPLPTLVYSSVPSPTKVAKKVAYPAKGSTDRSIQRSQTQLTLYAPKRINSPSNTPMIPRSKSSHDFQDIQYSDMFAEITSQQGSGPAMYQMFPSTVYVNAFNPCRETNSASSSRTRSSKGSRANSSRDSSARSKRTKPKSKKTSSASSHRRRNSSSKLEVIEKAQNKKENTVIISGVDWEIKAEKQNGGNIKFPLDGMMDIKNQNFELTTINEATIENSITSQTVKETLKTSREPERRSNKMESDDPKSGDVGLLQEMEDLGVLNSNCHRDSSHNVQAPISGRTTPPNCDLNPTQANPQPQQDQGLGDLVNDDKTRVSENNTEDEECTSQNIQGAQCLTGSEQLTDDLICCLKKLIIDKEAIGSLPDESEGEESGHFREWQDVDDENEPRDVEPGPGEAAVCRAAPSAPVCALDIVNATCAIRPTHLSLK
ncbi:mitogen-activated protein kinase kinase kinase 19 isoform X2 [Engystomops pustulosus]|uniref:mitogen-activated protein kinase kinase kinase 19 isoform X2 n=1 Tax=Engystomops pustulosus TaxID=76066 RepID=UPI003AFA8586